MNDAEAIEVSRIRLKWCEEFNKRNPVGTAGILHFQSRNVATVVDGPALVWPSPTAGATVMAWFSDCGWCDIARFTPGIPNKTTSEDLYEIGIHAKLTGRPAAANAIFRAAVEHDETNWTAWNEIGMFRASGHDWEGAVEAFDLGIEANGKAGELFYNRALALRATGRAVVALQDCRKAQGLMPGNEMVSLTAAYTLDDIGQTEEALAILNARVARRPDDTNALHNRALMLLSCGRLSEGWIDYDARLKFPACASHYEHFKVPRWDVSQGLSGKKILLWLEQGIGDELLTGTMIPELISRCASVTILCSRRLIPLFRRSFPSATVDHRPTAAQAILMQRRPLPESDLPDSVRGNHFDYQMSQCDLGKMLRPSMAAFPAASDDAYLLPATTHVIPRPEGNKLVGISWHSRRNTKVGAMKGVNARILHDILTVEGVTFVNLQYGDCENEISDVETYLGIGPIVRLSVDPLADMDGFASVVASLDLVITVSNTTAHVAGALGVPCWVMLPEGEGRLWYWFRTIIDSPWYPSVRLFRQPAASMWGRVISNVATALTGWVG